LTNLDYDEMRAAQLSGSRLRNDTFLSNKTGAILTECGLGDGEKTSNLIDPRNIFDGSYTTSTSARVAFSAWAFHAVMREAQSFLPIDAPPVSDLASLYRDYILPSAPIFYNREYPPDPVNLALSAAESAWTPASTAFDPHPGRMLRIPLDRVRHCLTLMGVVYPTGQWKLDVDIIKALNKRPTQDIMNWLDNHPEALLKVTMQRTDPQFESLINYGATLDNNRLAGHWVVATEAARLWGPCELTVHAAITAGRTATSAEWVTAKDLTIDPVDWERRAGNYAFHLWVDTLWRGLCKAPNKGPARQKSPGYTFVRAVDRELCFYAALKLKAAGLTVKGYGSGAVTIFLPEHLAAEDWIPSVLSAGLTPPLLSPGSLDLDWVTGALGMEPGVAPAPRTLLHAALLLGELDTVISLSEMLAPLDVGVG
jgi:hypothetical protein